mmetsp:Transcript_27182/g.68159  ORF Transcript_27182/g.68159 Transcript_27182/m.68159 type:complete len:267 (-) Transcript_27182:118-918(-)
MDILCLELLPPPGQRHAFFKPQHALRPALGHRAHRQGHEHHHIHPQRVPPHDVQGPAGELLHVPRADLLLHGARQQPLLLLVILDDHGPELADGVRQGSDDLRDDGALLERHGGLVGLPGDVHDPAADVADLGLAPGHPLCVEPGEAVRAGGEVRVLERSERREDDGVLRGEECGDGGGGELDEADDGEGLGGGEGRCVGEVEEGEEDEVEVLEGEADGVVGGREDVEVEGDAEARGLEVDALHGADAREAVGGGGVEVGGGVHGV